MSADNIKTKHFVELVTLLSSIVTIGGGIIWFISTNLDFWIYLTPIIFGILLLALYFLFRLSNRYDLKVIRGHSELSILDNTGNLAFFKKNIELKALKNNVKHIISGLYASGEIKDVKVDNAHISKKEFEMGADRIVIAFDNYLNRGDKERISISAEFHDSYNSNNESWGIKVMYPYDIYELEILFPEDRNPIDFTAIKKKGITERKCPVQPVRIQKGNKQAIRLEIRNLNVEDYYLVQWKW